jgi:hypothetical protein
MPYELSFTKKLQLADTEQYINQCCIGGDIVLDVFLPQLRREYGELQSDQEDWGWFATAPAAGRTAIIATITHNATLIGERRAPLSHRTPKPLRRIGLHRRRQGHRSLQAHDKIM